MTLALIVLALEIVILVPLFIYMVKTGISPVPTSRRARRAAFAALPDRIEGTLYDLGAGWGTVAFPLARRFPENRVIAIELSPVPWLVMRIRAMLAGLPNLTIRRRDFLGESVGDAGLVFIYQYPALVARLAEKLATELRPGALVISNGCPLPGWPVEDMSVADDLILSEVIVHRAPAPDGESDSATAPSRQPASVE